MQTRSFINKANLKNIKIKKCQTNNSAKLPNLTNQTH